MPLLHLLLLVLRARLWLVRQDGIKDPAPLVLPGNNEELPQLSGKSARPLSQNCW